MHGQYAYTPQIWASFLTFLFLLILSVYSGRRRSVPGASAFTVACLFAALWAAGSTMEYAALDLAAKLAWVKFQSVWHVPTVTAVTCFILEYTWPGRWLTRRVLALLSVVPLLTVVLILTNNLHHLAWRSVTFDGSSIQLVFGPAGWLLAIYGVGMFGIVNLIAFGWLFVRSPQHRWPVILMLIGQSVGRIIFLLDKTGILHPVLPIDLLGMAFEYLMYAIALFSFRIFDPIPLALKTAIEQLQSGVIVLDPRGKIVSLNPSAQAILGATKNHTLDHPIHGFLPVSDQLVPSGQTEIQLGAGTTARDYHVELSSLKDWRGVEVGHLLTLRDVTGQKQAQAQLLEQQRSLAALQEREHLARELHDELAQGLAVINLQAQLVSGLLDAGQMEQAQAQLQVLAKAARDAQLDVRGEISTLARSMAPEEGFVAALRRSTEDFQKANGVPTELFVAGEEPMFSIAPTLQVQLLRIVQEALTNIRKHARAKHVKVALARDAGCLQLLIEDDGVGFDRDSLPASRQNFGLDIMSERAGEINGRLEVRSAMGMGTKVLVEVPLGEP